MKSFKESFVAAFGSMLGMTAGLVAGAALLDKFVTKKKPEEAKTGAEKKMEEFEDSLK